MNKQHRFQATWPAVIVLTLTGLIVLPFYFKAEADKLKPQLAASAQQTTVVEARLTDAQAENQLLKEKLEQAAHVRVDDKTKELVRFYLRKYFGADAPRAEKIFTCESGLSPHAVHVNAPGLGADHGVAQINSRWHQARFEQMMGVAFEVGSHDIDMNLRYARFLWEHSGEGAWVCARLVAR